MLVRLRLGLIFDTDVGSVANILASRALVDITSLPGMSPPGRRGTIRVCVPGSLPRVIIFDVLVGSVGSRVLKANRGSVADVITMGALVDTTLGVRSGRQDGERNAAVQALHF
jgi:hypothetical protein